MEAANTFMELVKAYGPGVALAAVFAVLWWLERKNRIKAEDKVQEVAKALTKRNDEMADKLLTLSTDSIRADTEHTAAVQSLTRMLDSIDRRIR